MDAGLLDMIKPVLNDPWYAIMAACWAIGWMMKNLNFVTNKYIPTIIAVFGAILGFFIIESSLSGVLAGFLVGILSIGTHSAVKNSIQPR